MKHAIIALTGASFLIGACSTDPYTGERKVSNTATGAGTGALLGTAAGALLGTTTNIKTRKAMLVGAGLGALAGGGVGLYMDNQEAKLRERLEGSGVSVTRNGDNIILNMPSNITFATDQSDIRPAFYDVLNSVALVLREFNQTLVDVNGHTDADGCPNGGPSPIRTLLVVMLGRACIRHLGLPLLPRSCAARSVAEGMNCQ